MEPRIDLEDVAGKLEGVRIGLHLYAEEQAPSVRVFDPDGWYLDLLLDGLDGVADRVNAIRSMAPPKAVA